jgi:hypothetical protein
MRNLQQTGPLSGLATQSSSITLSPGSLAELSAPGLTGLGAVTPLASEIATSWQWLIGGRSAAAAIKSFDASGFAVGFALGVSETLVPALPTEREMSSRWLYRTFNTSAPKQHA